MSIHKKLDQKGRIIELLATNEDAAIANAAPDLLSICKDFVFLIEETDMTKRQVQLCIDIARQTIAKVEGS